jgi:hypothetical protein
MTQPSQPVPATAQQLKALASALNEQLMELSSQVSLVRHLLQQEARRMKRASGPSGRPFSRSKGDPITVVHGARGMTTLPGHPDLGGE